MKTRNLGTSTEFRARSNQTPGVIGHLSRIALRFAACVGVIYAVALVVANVVTLADLQLSRFDGSVEQAHFEDHVAFYAAGKLVLDGKGSEIYNVEVLAAEEHAIMGREVGGRGSLAFFNPPFVALGFAPLALLSVAQSAMLLLLINSALVAVAGLILYKLLDIRSRWLGILYWLGVISFEPVVYVVGQGQLSMFVVLGLIGFYVFQRQEKSAYSGFALGLLLVKPQTILLATLILLWKRQWRTLAAFSGMAAVLIVLSMIVAGPAALWEYPKFLIDSTNWEGTRGVDTQGMYGWNGFFSTVTPYREPLHLALTATATVATIGAVFYAFRGAWTPESAAFPHAIAALCLGTLLINAHVYLHDVLVLGVAILLDLYGWRGNSKKVSQHVAVSLLAWFLLSRTLWLLAEFHLNLITPLAAILLIFAVRDAVHRASAESESAPRMSKYEVSDSQLGRKQVAS